MDFVPVYSLTVILLFVLFLWYKDHTFSQREMQKERKDLYDRLQAGTLSHYKIETEDDTPTVEAESVDLNLSDIESARDDLMGETEQEENNGQ